MSARRLYYHAKPWLPWRVRLTARRLWARRIRKRFADTWPINNAAGSIPAGWPGWPGGKQFALVLTHDVESPEGIERCLELMNLEMRLGFRSSFNFIPEGPYAVPKELRQELLANGFEVGVHDLKHDGKLYQSRRVFRERAKRINHYLEEWNAVGFRSAFMLHNLDWMHDLNIEYDASTFDSDPFEPQPEGTDTIFPFWVPGTNGSGYVELPYTLPQDFGLFILLQEQTIDLWKQKLDWIVGQGGMAMLDTHPDYLNFSLKNGSTRQFPATHYESFLKYVLSRHGQSYWNPLPRQVAALLKERRQSIQESCSRDPHPHQISRRPTQKIWIDLDNTPHVPFFEPIVEELSGRGYDVFLTARDAFQVCELADKKGMRYVKVGRHHGKNSLRKVMGLCFRALQLAPIILREKPTLGLSHGSRSQLILCNLLRLPSIMMTDYEYARFPFPMRPTFEILPDMVPDTAGCCPKENIKKYPGIKEDVYASSLKPNPEILLSLGLSQTEIAVTVRPPATEAHYHNPESDALFIRFMERACQIPGVRLVLLPRHRKQAERLQDEWPHWFAGSRTMIPSTVVDGLNLLWHSDLVVSGGGTMNREAAALGIPVYSIFRGKIGAVDEYLRKQGRLTLVESLDDINRKIIFRKRQPVSANSDSPHGALSSIIGHVIDILDRSCPPKDLRR